MNKFKRFYSLLCFLLMFCVGFLSIGNTVVYAYEKEDNFYPIMMNDTRFRVFFNSWSEYQDYTISIVDNNQYKINNPILKNVYAFEWRTYDGSIMDLSFPYSPDVYDYYILGNVIALNSDVANSTFKPTIMEVYGYDYASNTSEYYPLSGLDFYDIDTYTYSGFGWSAKIDFKSKDNIGISHIAMAGDKDGIGNKPANLYMNVGILAIEKTGSVSNVLSQILNQLQDMEENITENIQNAGNNIAGAVGQAGEKVSGAVNEAGDKIANKVEEQYQMDESEDFGVGDITEEVEEKLGVLTVGTDTLIGFLDLFDASNAGSTTITFPAFKIEVQGQSYNVWNDIQYDLSTLEDDFGILIDSVRTVLVLCVWLAVLSYLVKAKDHFINGGG